MKNIILSIKSKLGPLGWGVLLVFVISRCGDVANLVSRFFLGRALKSVDFGAIEPVISTLAILAVPTVAIFQVGVKSISRLKEVGDDDKRRALIADLAKVAAVGSVISILIVVALSSFILERLHLDSNIYIPIIAALFVLAWWSPLAQAVIQGGRHYRLMSVPSIVSPFLMLILMFVFVGVFDWGLPGAMFARIIAASVAVLLVFVLLRSVIIGNKEPYHDEMKVIKSAIIPMFLFLGSLALLLHFDRLFVRNFLLSDSGGYGAVIALGMIPSYFVAPLVFVMFPLASAEHAGGRGIRRMFLQAMGVGLLVTAVCAAGFWLFGGKIVEVWNADFSPYANYIWIYAISAGLLAMIRIVAMVEMARHRYGFIWVIMLPALIMSGVMYMRRTSIELLDVILIALLTRIVILVGFSVVGLINRRKNIIHHKEHREHREEKGLPTNSANEHESTLC